MKQYRNLKWNDFFEIVSRISSTYKNKTEGGNPSSVNLCGRRESNPYASRHQILSLACLPISTRPRQYLTASLSERTANVRQFIGFANFCPAISPLPSQSIYISQNWIYLHWYNEYIPLLTSYPLIPGNMFHVYLYFQSQARPIL